MLFLKYISDVWAEHYAQLRDQYGDRKSFSQHHIDWQHPERNVYHVTEEFVVEKQGSHSTRRPDIVLFVNGIPWS